MGIHVETQNTKQAGNSQSIKMLESARAVLKWKFWQINLLTSIPYVKSHPLTSHVTKLEVQGMEKGKTELAFNNLENVNHFMLHSNILMLLHICINSIAEIAFNVHICRKTTSAVDIMMMT